MIFQICYEVVSACQDFVFTVDRCHESGFIFKRHQYLVLSQNLGGISTCGFIGGIIDYVIGAMNFVVSRFRNTIEGTLR